jgi:signal transduction histidine kinase
MSYLDRLQVDLPRFPPGSLNAYLFAVALVAAATVLRVLLDPWLSGVQFITFSPAVIVTTLFCGVAAGILAMVLSGLSGWFFIIADGVAFEAVAPEQRHALVLFLLVSAADVVFIGALRAAITRTRELSRTLEQRVAERTRELTEQMRRREAAEEHLRQAQKAEAIGQLTGGVAHDFNNLLMAIMGNLELLDRRVSGEREHKMVANALRAAERGARLTAQLLAFARKQRLAPQPVDVNALVGAAQELLRPSLGAAVRIETELAPGLWPALVDPTQLEMMLVNLAINARDAMAPNGGTLTIRTGNVPRGGTVAPPGLPDADSVMLAVSDTGMGMSEEVQARAFDPFFTTKEPGGGSGLGLSQVHGAVTQSGGTVELESRPGRGTTVRLYLPRAPG